MKLLMLKGLPASGKSTFSKELVDKGWARTNKDDLRALMHDSKHTKGNESQVLAIRDAIVEDSLQRGRNVVVDDTGFNPVHRERLQELAKKYGAQFEERFFDTPIEECISRDLKRPNSVGERVIRQMHSQYLTSNPITYIPPEGKPKALIADIDGTIAWMADGRSPYDWHRVGEDVPNPQVVDYLRYTASHGVIDDNKIYIILMSGRDSVCRPETEKWLADNRIPYDHLYMRPEGNNENDAVVKKQLFDRHIRDNYQVNLILDDRKRVVKMWREELGLTVWQVAPGDF